MIHHMSCQHCTGDYGFEVESADPEVGLFGYQTFYVHNPTEHDPECPDSRLCGPYDERFEEIENYISNKANASDYFDHDDYGVFTDSDGFGEYMI